MSGSLYLRQQPHVLEFKPDIPPAHIVKDMGGRWRDGVWQLPPVLSSYYNLNRVFPSLRLSQGVESWVQDPFGRQGASEILPSLIPMYDKLADYQKEGVEFLATSSRPGSLLSFAPGLGKTLTAIAASYCLAPNRVLVICQKSLIPHWEEELLRWAKVPSFRCHGRSPHDCTDGRIKWFITNYETVTRRVNQFSISWDLVIIDESILVKNRATQRFKHLQKLVREKSKKTWLLSGSPISNFYDDLYGQFAIIDPQSFPSYWRFANQYCHVQTSPWGDQIVGSKLVINPRLEFRDIMLTRDKSEVLQLPDMEFQTLTVELGDEQRRLYRQMTKEFMVMLGGQELTVTNKLVQLTRLLQLASNTVNLDIPHEPHSAKAEVLFDLIETGSVPLPSIVWTNWVRGGDWLSEEVKRRYPNLRVGRVSGSQLAHHNEQMILDFREGKLDLIFLSLKIGKHGHNLPVARSMVYFDKSFDGDAWVQSLARVHRRGLTHSPLIISLKVRRTVDELVDRRLLDKVVSIAAVSNADLKQLLGGLIG